MKKNLLIFCFCTAVMLNACTPYETVTSHVITFEEAPESLLANSPYGDNLLTSTHLFSQFHNQLIFNII
ncbi:MAG: hypothetical protein WCX21_03660 [Bacteroidales bacterium]